MPIPVGSRGRERGDRSPSRSPGPGEGGCADAFGPSRRSRARTPTSIPTSSIRSPTRPDTDRRGERPGLHPGRPSDGPGRRGPGRHRRDGARPSRHTPGRAQPHRGRREASSHRAPIMKSRLAGPHHDRLDTADRPRAWSNGRRHLAAGRRYALGIPDLTAEESRQRHERPCSASGRRVFTRARLAVADGASPARGSGRTRSVLRSCPGDQVID